MYALRVVRPASPDSDRFMGQYALRVMPADPAAIHSACVDYGIKNTSAIIDTSVIYLSIYVSSYNITPLYSNARISSNSASVPGMPVRCTDSTSVYPVTLPIDAVMLLG